MLNIVIPMAGEGSRFRSAGFVLPKPLIDVAGTAMIELVVDNLRPSSPHRFIFVCRQSHEEQFGISELLERIAPGSRVVFTSALTGGAASSVLLAKDLISNADPLLIANSDQYIDFDVNTFLGEINYSAAGTIMTMSATGPKWSYVARNQNGQISEVVEKVEISAEATVGVYYFSQGKYFVEAAESMVLAGEKSSGEYYVAPVYNRIIAAGHFIDAINVGEIEKDIFGLGTPDDLAIYLSRVR